MSSAGTCSSLQWKQTKNSNIWRTAFSPLFIMSYFSGVGLSSPLKKHNVAMMHLCYIYIESNKKLRQVSIVIDPHYQYNLDSESDSATTSKSKNLGTGPRRGTLPDSLTRFSENCLHISSILTNFV